MPFCEQHGIGVICYSPLMQGLLTGRWANADEARPTICHTTAPPPAVEQTSHALVVIAIVLESKRDDCQWGATMLMMIP